MAENKQPAPLNLQQVAEMLERATQAVRSTQHTLTAEAVKNMSVAELRQDAVLEEAFQQGWTACVAAINRTLRSAGQPQAKRPRTSYATAVAAKPPPRQAATRSKPPPRTMVGPKAKDRGTTRENSRTSSATGKGSTTTASTSPQVKPPPPPSTLSVVERRRVPGGKPGTPYRPTNTAAENRPSTSRDTSGTPASRETTKSVAETTKEGPSRKEKNRNRFREMLARKKARKAEAVSQQYRLNKSPCASTSTISTPLSPVPPPTPSEPMEVDQPDPVVTATSGNPTDLAAGVESSRDVDDVYLDSPVPSLPALSESDEDEQPFFGETPPTSPGHR